MAGRHRLGALQQQGALADAGIPPEQHQRTRHQTTAQHAVKFAVPTAQALQGAVTHGGDGLRAARGRGNLAFGIGHRHGTAAAVIARRGGLLHQAVPTAAARAASKKLPGLGSAALADVGAGGASQSAGGGGGMKKVYDERRDSSNVNPERPLQ